MGDTRLPPLNLTKDEHCTLQNRANRRTTAQGLALRARIVLECAKGHTNLAVAARLDISRKTVTRWRSRFLAHRLDGLADEPRPGAPRTITDAQVEEVVVRTLETTPPDATHWSKRSLAAQVGISPSSVGRIWKAFGLQPWRTQDYKLSPDPLLIDKIRDVVGLYLSPPAGAAVFSVDEKPQIQALRRTAPVLPMIPGVPERRSHDYRRGGTVDLFAALEVATGKVTTRLSAQHRAVDFRDFLDQIDRQVDQGMNRSTVARWESGTTTPHPGQRPSLAQALQITRDQLEALLHGQVRTPDRRTVLVGGGALAASALVLPVVGAHDLQRILDVIQDARRRLGQDTLEYFGRAMDQAAADDGLHGPGTALPGLLGVLAAITDTVRQVRPAHRDPLLRLGVRGAELAAWFYRDLGWPAAADQWRDQAIVWARQADEPALEAYVLLRRAQAAWDTRDAPTMITLSTAVLNRHWGLPAQVRAEALQQQARGHALAGQPIGVISRSLDRAADLLASSDSAGTLSQHYGRSLFAIQVALCHAEADRAANAVELYEEHLRPEAFTHRDHAYLSSLQALALADAGYPERACEIAMEALPIAREVGSRRTLSELARLPDRLRSWHNRAAVRDTVQELTLAAQ